MAEQPTVSQVSVAAIASGLRALGIEPGDTAFVHSSLRSFGYVEGGAACVVRAFLDVLGTKGTLAVPTFVQFFDEGPDQVWDRDHTPSRMGVVSECARTWPGALRGHNATHPIAAIGPLAEDLTERDNVTAWGFDSAFQRLIELNAWIVLAGVDWNVCTLVHLLEERAEVPYRYWAERTGLVIEGGVARRKTYRCLTRYWGVLSDFQRLGNRLEEQGHVHSAQIGQSQVRAVRARDLYDVGTYSVRRDPLFLVSADTKDVAQRYLPDYGAALDAYGSRHDALLTPANPTARRLAAVLKVPVVDDGPQVQERNRWQTDDGLILEELRFTGGPNSFVPALLARPCRVDGPLPAVVCLHGTGGTWEREMEPALLERGSTVLGWARELARRGYLALAITQLNHPPRQEPGDWREPRLLPLYGKTGMGRLVADAVLCLDYLSRRPDVDSARIGMGGFSLGGIVSFYTFALDPRVAAAFTFCGGVGSVRQLLRVGETRAHTAYYYPPNLLAEGLDHPQLVPAIAPRPFLVCGATQDVCMPVGAFKAFVDAAQVGYASAGAPDAFASLLEEGPHALTLRSFETAAAWLREKL